MFFYEDMLANIFTKQVPCKAFVKIETFGFGL